MALIPLIDCYELLDIDPKTLRLSLKRADMEVCPHPTDARIKCLTTEQIELLAVMHARPLRPNREGQAGGEVTSCTPAQLPSAAHLTGERESKLPSQEEISLSQKLSQLERHVEKLSEQVIELATLLLKAQERRLSSELTKQEHDLKEREGKPLSFSQESMPQPLAASRLAELHPAEARKRALLPLIEYSADGLCLIVSHQKGGLRFEPDSKAWFSFLATISSFRFVGKSGRFSACRNSEHGQQTRSWVAHRCIHGHNYRQHIGVTDCLTLDRLEQTAARFQEYLVKS